ncbi:MAG: 2-oxoacid:acceptor oxidoreductase family protein [Spirochaetales bacterium]|nr:2-oxoacid:acceptor oxidoreductase family protein [Spirochaetales bacterium]
MNNPTLNIFITGVGGQGIGLLSEALMRAYDYAGFPVKGVDTHGLAQRGGCVVSHLRIGFESGSPLIEEGKADILLSLERSEAYRNMSRVLRRGGSLAYYDTVWQALPERLGVVGAVNREMIEAVAEERNLTVYFLENRPLEDGRMQNTALLGFAFTKGVFPGLKLSHLISSLEDLLPASVLEKNLKVLKGDV